MLTWQVASDQRGISADGKQQSYWICDRPRFPRPRRVVLWVRHNKRHVAKGSYDYLTQAMLAAETMER
jgi:hypothetical protein